MKQRSDGRYVQTATINGKRHFFYSTETNEKRALKDIQRQMIEFEEKQENGLTFAEVAEQWKSVHFETVENNTLKQYRPATADVIKFFGNTPIKSITTAQIDRYIKSYAAKGYAAKTVKTRLLMLNLIFKFAYVNMHVTQNPCTYVNIPKNLPKSKRDTLSQNEIEIVRNSIDCTFGLYAFFLLYTGLRKGEALALTYNDIDFENKIIHVNKTVEWLGNVPEIKTHPKTDAGIRDVPFLDILSIHFKPLKSSALVFPNANGELIRNGNFNRLWDKYRAETGLNITPHMLRHAYTTILFEKGIDVKTAQSILGHANIQTTMDIYTHFTETKLTTTTETLNKLIT